MIEITLKENGTKYQLPISDEQLAEIKYLLNTSVIDACEYEVDYKSKYYDILPATADLEQLNNIARDIEVLEKQDKIYWLEAVMLAEELGEIKLKTTLEKPSKIEIAIDGIFSQKYFYDWDMSKAEYAKQEYELGNLDYLHINDEIADCLDWEKIYNKFLTETAIVINGGILTIGAGRN